MLKNRNYIEIKFIIILKCLDDSKNYILRAKFTNFFLRMI